VAKSVASRSGNVNVTGTDERRPPGAASIRGNVVSSSYDVAFVQTCVGSVVCVITPAGFSFQANQLPVCE
jgi:hypothetical protein